MQSQPRVYATEEHDVDECTTENEVELLIESARGGDEAAFGRLVEGHKESVFATVMAITRDFDVAHDIAQEVFLRAWFGLAGLEESDSFGAWLRTIARNRSLTWLERRQRQPVQETIEMDSIAHGGEKPDEAVERSERRRLVLAAMERLPEASREVLLLHYMQGLSTPRVATQLGISDAAVRQRLRRARLQMQEEVTEMVADVIRDEAPGEEFSEGVTDLMTRAREIFQRVEYGSAVPVLESAREQAPQDTRVSMLLAEAYTFTRSVEELESDRGAYDRALALFDEVLEREPQNMLARLRRAALRANLGSDEEVFSEHQQIATDAAGTPFEAVAQLELARRHLTRGQAQEALALYDVLKPKYPWLACVLHSEMGVAFAMAGDGMAALTHFDQAVELTTQEAMEELQEVSRGLMGEAYWTHWSTVDNVPVRQCQNHAWLSGIRARAGDMKAARQHVRQAVAYLDDEEIGPARKVLRREFVNQMEQMFPELAGEPEVQQLKRQIDEEG